MNLVAPATALIRALFMRGHEFCSFCRQRPLKIDISSSATNSVKQLHAVVVTLTCIVCKIHGREGMGGRTLYFLLPLNGKLLCACFASTAQYLQNLKLWGLHGTGTAEAIPLPQQERWEMQPSAAPGFDFTIVPLRAALRAPQLHCTRYMSEQL